MATGFRLQDNSSDRQIDPKLRGFLDQPVVGTYLIQDGTFVYINEATARIFGYEPEEVIGKQGPLDGVVAEDRREVQRNLNRRLEGTANDIRYTFRAQRKDGSTTKVEVHGFRVFYRGESAVMGTLRDLQQTAEDLEKEELEQLKRRVYFDEVTGLPDRTFFFDELERTIRDVRSKSGSLSVFFVNLSDIVEINKGYGYRVGESILRSVAERLQERLESEEILCRWSLGKFVVLLRGPHEVETKARDLIRLFDDPIYHQGSRFFLTTNIGIATFPDHAEDSERLIGRANLAVERAQDDGDNNYAIYSPDDTHTTRRLIPLSTDLRKALRDNQFTLRYLPIFDLSNGHMSGLEALIRWNHPTFGTLDPDVFIPVAERSGFMTDIDEHVIKRACREFQPPVGESTDLKLSLNLSASHFYKRDFGSRLNGYLHDAGVGPENITLEITEHTLMEDVERARRILKELRERGMRIAVDDFGTGHSSFRYLAELPVDILKIDRSFVQSLGEKPDRDNLVSVLCSVGHQLDLELVAEGVETRYQLRYLSEQGCDRIQGFLFSRPISWPKISELLGRTVKL